MFRIVAVGVALAALGFAGDGDPAPESRLDAPQPAPPQPGPAQPEPPQPGAAPPAAAAPRSDVNVLGVANAAKGESRRNENVQFNLIDNNAFKELAIRLGSTATLIQEFEADKGYFGAEFGQAPSTEIHLSPSSGSDLHGQFYFRHLNSVTSARSFFQVGGVKPARENGYGATVAAGLWDGGFLTVRASQKAIRGNVNGNVLVPLPEERTPLATDPAVRDIVSTLLEVFPDETPNRPDINPRMLNTNSPQSIDDDILGAKLDQQFGEKNHFAFDYSFFLQFVDSFQLVRTQNPDTTTRNHKARITYARTISPSTTLDATVGYERVGSLLTQEDFPLRLAVFVSSALTSYGNGSFIPIDRSTNNFRYATQVRRQFGRHVLNLGGRLHRTQINGSEVDSHRGVFSFNTALGEDAVTNLRLGRPSNYYRSFGNVHRGFRNWSGGLFAGDRWRVSDAFTLDYGLRWGFFGRATEVDDINVVPYDDDNNNFAPRFGFAWRLPRKAGVVRSNFGVHYGRIFDVTYMQTRYNAPQSVKVVVPLPDILDPDAGIDAENLNNIRGLIYDLDPELASPYSMQYNLSWEREIGADWTLNLGYVGSRSPKLLGQWYQNRARMVPGLEPTLSNVNERRLEESILERRRVLNGSRGYFDAAKVVLRAPSWRRFNVDASYWFSKLMDLGADYANTAAQDDSFRSRSQREDGVHQDMKALSRFDQPHAFLLRLGYETPQLDGAPRWAARALGSWTLSTVTLLKSGTPFNIETGSDAPGFGNVDGTGGDRPMLLDTSILGNTVGHPDDVLEKLPREAFGYLTPGGAGTLGRYAFRKGPIRNINLSLARRWAVRGDAWLKLSADSINFFNTPQFAEPGDRLSDPNFGAITNTLNEGRTMRFSLEAGF